MNPNIEDLNKAIEQYNPDSIFQPNAEVSFQPTAEVTFALAILKALLSVFKDPFAMAILFREKEMILQLKSFNELLYFWPLGNIVLLQQFPAKELITEILDYPLFPSLVPNLHKSLAEMMDIGASYLENERNLKALAESIVGTEPIVGEKGKETAEAELTKAELLEDEVQFEIVVDPTEETVFKRPPALFIPDSDEHEKEPEQKKGKEQKKTADQNEFPTGTLNYGHILRKLKISQKNAAQEFEENCVKNGKIWRIKKAASKISAQIPF